MNEENYVGHRSQLYGVEEHRLVGGKGDGMRLFQIKNGRGIDFTVSADRCADISRLSLHGVNVGYFGPCGYVAPQYYDGAGFGFLKSFTAGFLTTCGFTTIGSPSTDEGEDLPLHGNISHVPAEEIHYEIGADEILVRATMTDASLFGRKLTMTRTIACGLSSNKIRISDKIANRGSETSPLMLLYHVNIGYPLLDETSDLRIPSTEVIPRDARAKEASASGPECSLRSTASQSNAITTASAEKTDARKYSTTGQESAFPSISKPATFRRSSNGK